MKVSVGADKGSLRLRWKFEGRQYTLGLGLQDDAIGRRLAEERANRIYLDLLSGNFDRTLAKYRTGRVEVLTVEELGVRYAKARSSEVGKQTAEGWRAAFAFLRNQRMSGRSLAEVDDRRAAAIADLLRKSRSPETAKKYLTIYATAWDWAIEGRWVDHNPWRSEAAKVRIPSLRPPEIYSREEIAKILDAFANHPSKPMRSYWTLAVFLLSTGCRLGEAFALRWENVADDGRRVWIGEAIERGGAVKETKTREARWVELNRSCRAALVSMRQSKNPAPADLVFTGARGGVLSDRNWRRIWANVLKLAGVPYRRPYLARHTVASHALDANYPITEVAEQIGNLPSTLLARYAGAARRRAFPDLLGPDPDGPIADGLAETDDTN